MPVVDSPILAASVVERALDSEIPLDDRDVSSSTVTHRLDGK